MRTCRSAGNKPAVPGAGFQRGTKLHANGSWSPTVTRSADVTADSGVLRRESPGPAWVVSKANNGNLSVESSPLRTALQTRACLVQWQNGRLCPGRREVRSLQQVPAYTPHERLGAVVPDYSRVARSAEHPPVKRSVAGSNPASGARSFGPVAKRSTAAAS